MAYTPENNPYIPGDPYSYDLKWIVDEVKTAIELYSPLSADFQELHDYVMDYFANLDVNDEISAKLDQMAADGSLSALIQPLFDAYKAEIDGDIAAQNEAISVLNARMDTFASLPDGSTAGDAELTDIRVGANGQTFASAGAAVRGQFNTARAADVNISALLGYDLLNNNFASGAYSTSGIVSNTGRAYCIYEHVNKRSKLFFDASKWSVTYYYITAVDDFTPLKSYGTWDTTGVIDLDYKNDGIVFVAVRAGAVNISSRMAEINSDIYLFNSVSDEVIQYHGPISGTTLANDNALRGFYTIGGATTAATAAITDMPVDNFAGGFLFNMSAGGSGSATIQMLFSLPTNQRPGRIYSRLLAGTNTNWVGIPYINWLAFGDSITHGSYSNAAGQTLNNPSYSWTARLANTLWGDKVLSFTNCAVRGIGWVNTGNNGETFDDMMESFTGDRTAINLVTIMLGINDYISGELLGTTESAENDGTISGAIRYGIKYLCENYPNAKIVVISPLNSRNHGNAANGWSRNTRLTRPGTLQDICNMIAYWCDVYNVTYINEISESFINNYNITNFLGDALHPTIDGHWQLARELAGKIDI